VIFLRLRLETSLTGHLAAGFSFKQHFAFYVFLLEPKKALP